MAVPWFSAVVGPQELVASILTVVLEDVCRYSHDACTPGSKTEAAGPRKRSPGSETLNRTVSKITPCEFCLDSIGRNLVLGHRTLGNTGFGPGTTATLSQDSVTNREQKAGYWGGNGQSLHLALEETVHGKY